MRIFFASLAGLVLAAAAIAAPVAPGWQPLPDFTVAPFSGWSYANGPARITETTVSQDQPSVAGRASLKLGWEFEPTATTDSFAAIGHRFKCWGTPSAYRMRIYAEKPGITLSFRYTDASGQTFQWTLGKVDWTGWKTVEIPIAATESHWGGDNDGVLHPPAYLQDVTLGWSAGAARSGTLELADLEVAATLSPWGDAELRYTGGGLVATTGSERVTFALTGYRNPPTPGYQLHLEVADAAGKAVATATRAVAMPQSGTGEMHATFPVRFPPGRSFVARARLTAPDGAMVTAARAELAGVPDRTAGALEPESVFGLCHKSLDTAMLTPAGIKWIRVDLDYRPDLTFEENVKGLDAIMANAARDRIMVLGIFNPRRFQYVYQPGGVRQDHASAGSAAHSGYASLAAGEKIPRLMDWGNWVYRVVSRYRGRIRCWEVSNEPDLAPVPPPHYAALVKAAYVMAKQADPACFVGAFSTAGINLPFITGGLRNGVGGYCDFVTVHPYQWCHAYNPELMLSQLASLEKVLADNGAAGRPVWMTEFGWPSQPVGGVSESRQAELLAQLYLTCAAVEKYKMFWYCSGDYPAAPTDQEGYFGLFRGDGRPKPAFYAYLTVAKTLDGARGLGRAAAVPPGCAAWRYRLRDGRAALALWSADDRAREIELPLPDLAAGSGVELVAIDGTRTFRSVAGGQLRLTVGGAPVVVLFQARRAEAPIPRPVDVLPPARSPRPLFLAVPRLGPAFPGQPFQIPFSVVNGGDRPVTVTPRLTMPAGWTLTAAPGPLACASRDEMDGAFTVSLAAGALPGPVTLRLQASGCDDAPVECEVALPFTLAVAPLMAPLRNGVFTLNARLTNGGVAPLRGSVAMSVPDAQVTPAGAVAVNLAPGRSLDLAYTVKLGTVPESLSARFSGSVNGLPFTLDRAVSSACIPRRTRPVTVDGSLDDWPRSPAFQLGEPGQVRPDVSWWHGPADLSGRLWFQWDAEVLYIAADVSDNVHFQPATGGATWMGDGFQFTFGGTQAPLYEILIAKTARGPEVYQLVAPGGGVGPVPGAHIAIKELAGRLVYEVAIPWTALAPLRGEAGARLPMNFILNDNDGAGRLGYLECRPGIGNGKFMGQSLTWLLAPAPPAP